MGTQSAQNWGEPTSRDPCASLPPAATLRKRLGDVPPAAYAGVENAIVELWAKDGIPLRLEKLEPRGEEFEWVIIRADQFEEFEEHIKGEREWHSQLSRSYQRFRRGRRV